MKTSSDTKTDEINTRAQTMLGKLPALGPILWLYMHSPTHRHFFVTDLEWLVLPPLALKQSRLYMKDKMPLAWASWAKVNEQVSTRLGSGSARLKPAEWNSGDRVWLMDLVTPFGGVKGVVKDLRENVFTDDEVHILRSGPTGVSPAVWSPDRLESEADVAPN